MTPVVRRNSPVCRSQSWMRPLLLEAGEGFPVGTERHVDEPDLLEPKREPILVSELPEIAPLPAAEVGLARRWPQEVEETAKAADVVGVPGGQGQVGAGGVHGPAELLLGGEEAGVGLVGLATGRGLLRPCAIRTSPGASRRLASLAGSGPGCGTAPSASNEAAVASISTPVSTAPSTAMPGLRRAHRQYRSAALTWRARIGSSARNRPRSSPIASAVWYRAFGSFSIALSTIVSRSRGIRPSTDRGRGGSSVLIRSISSSRSDESNPGRRVSSS